MNGKALVAYFSASGKTAIAARTLSDAADADIFEICPSEKYTEDDLDWMDRKSRTTKEMNDRDARPEIKYTLNNPGDYDVIYLGYPIWWYTAPRIINTFIESYDFSGKTIIPFATSGGTGVEKSLEDLSSMYPNINWGKALLLNGEPGLEDMKAML